MLYYFYIIQIVFVTCIIQYIDVYIRIEEWSEKKNY